jgi:hypothetical protein
MSIFLRPAENILQYLKQRCAYFEDYISTISAEPQKSLGDHLLHYCFSLELCIFSCSHPIMRVFISFCVSFTEHQTLAFNM